MKMRLITTELILIVSLIITGCPSLAVSADWPQWRGPQRDGKSSEKGLLKKWPVEGPKLLWSADGLGLGFSAVSIADGLIYATGTLNNNGSSPVQDSPVYDIPRMETIVIDGNPEDWGQGGFRIGMLRPVEGEIKPARDHDASVRLGWNDQGLLMLATVRDNLWIEHPQDKGPWSFDSIELFLAPKRGAVDLCQWAISPGITTERPSLDWVLNDCRIDKALKKLPAELTAARTKVKDGVVIEALLPWGALAIEPRYGREVGFQVWTNDLDELGDRHHYIATWYPATGTNEHTANMHRIRLAKQSGSCLTVLAQSSYDEERSQNVISLVASKEEAGKVITIVDAGNVVASDKLAADGTGRSAALIHLPKLPMDKSYGSLSVQVDGKEIDLLAVQDQRKRTETGGKQSPIATTKEGILFCFDLEGKLKWKKSYGPEWEKSYPGARTTPTVDNGHVYVVGGTGTVSCFDAQTGDKKWAVDVFNDFNGHYGSWGVAESLLIVGDLVICTPGGEKASVVALDKKTGRTVWASANLGEKSSYCSPILIERGTRKIIVTMLEKSLVGIDSQTGKLLFSDLCGKGDIKPITPLYSDGGIYATSGYNDGSVMYELSADGSGITKKWTDKVLDCHHGGVVEVDGYIYGANWVNNANGNWVCLDWKSGKVMYDTKWLSKGSLTYADGMLYCYEEKQGTVALVKATAENFQPVSSFKVPLGTGKHWAHPVVCNGCLYIRHGDTLMAYDIKAK